MTTLGIVLTSALGVGCAADNSTKQNLQAGYAALESKNFDEAIGRADEQLSRAPQGAGAADALYLKGRGLEERPKPDPSQARADLDQARQCYVDALQLNPGQPLSSYVRTSLANVDYSQDNYNDALREWNDVYPTLSDPDTKSWVLYRIGLCQQRLGQFDAADRTYSSVVESYPNTVPAERARQHMGRHAFAVQIATFADAASAEKAMQKMRSEGAMPSHLVDPAGHHIVTIGPAPNYAQAQQLKARFAGAYPDAVIVP